jgi:hypothetical protein
MAGRGTVEVALHDATLNPSTSFHHAAGLVSSLIISSVIASNGIQQHKEHMPYIVLVEADGGPAHNITFLRNILALVGGFMLGNMDHLVTI